MGSVTGWTRTNLHPGPNLGQTQTLEHRIFDPYGQIIRSTGPLAPDIPVGHQGLFHERLDYATNPGSTPRVFEPWSRHIVLNRSRVYLPSHGRFAQQDPNATGATPVTSVGFHAATPWASVDSLTPMNTFGDGLSLYGYVAQNPLQRSDPTGLFLEYIGGIGPFDTLMLGIELGVVAAELMGAYAGNLEADIDWATDWSQGDDMYSSSGQWISVGAFAESDDEEAPSGQIMAGLSSGGGKATKIARAFGDGISRFNNHHVVARYITKHLKSVESKMARIPEKLHQAYHKFLEAGMKEIGAPPMNSRLHTGPMSKRAPTLWKNFIKTNGGPKAAHAKVRAVIDQRTRDFVRQHRGNGLTDAEADEWLKLLDDHPLGK